MDDDLTQLKNVGKTSAQWLHAAGIHNSADLRRVGAVDAFWAVRKRGFHASKVLLYAIDAALMDIPWSALSAEHKQRLDSSCAEGAKTA